MKRVYDLELHEFIDVEMKGENNATILFKVYRVPGGFIYSNTFENINIFINYNEDLKEKKVIKNDIKLLMSI